MYVESYVNFWFHKVQVLETIKNDRSLDKDEKETQRSRFLTSLGNIKKDLISVGNEGFKTTDPDYLRWIRANRELVLPEKTVFAMNNIKYDIKVNPMLYLFPMIRMMDLMEINQSENRAAKLKNVLPSRNSLIPKNIRLDTTTMNRILGYYKETKKQRELFEGGEYVVWDDHFRTERKCFKLKGYRFNHQIVTDGVACSLLFIREDQYGEKARPGGKKAKMEEKYLDQLTRPEIDSLRESKRKVIGIDPNMGNLLYCAGENGEFFRYTHAQRKFESKDEKYQDYQEQLFHSTIVDGLSIKEWEATLSSHNSKTLQPRHYNGYLWKRLFMDKKISKVYQDFLLRKNRLHAYRNRKLSEFRLQQNLKKKYGKPSNSVVCLGDWEQAQHMRYKEPVKGKGFRKLLRQFGYQVYLVDEYRTSKLCADCKNPAAINKKFFNAKYKTKSGKSRSKTLHALVKCKTCARVWNRDTNSSINIRRIGRSMIDTGERPDYLCRQSTNSVNEAQEY
jgi:transposase